MRCWQALGMGVLVKIIRHLGFVCSWNIIVRHWSHIGGWSQAKHCLQASMSIFRFGFMVNRSRLMVGWLGLMVHWGWFMVGRFGFMVHWGWFMISLLGCRMVGCVNTKYLLKRGSMCRFSISTCRILVGWSWVMNLMMDRMNFMMNWVNRMMNRMNLMMNRVMDFMMSWMMDFMVTMMHQMSHMRIFLHVVKRHVKVEDSL